MKIALVQMEMTERVDENLEKTLRFMGEAAQNYASLVCFPEIQLSPFFPQHRDRDVSKYVMELSHPAVQSIREKCRELGLVAVPNLYLEQGGQRFDASPVIDSDGSVLGVSKMVHIVQAPQFYERDYYTQSETGFQVYETSVGKVGVVICFDRHFPESTRACALKGAELVVIPTANTKTEPLDIFEAEIRVAAYQNNMYIAMCNRVGLEDEMDFCGESLVMDPNGNLIAKAKGREQILYAEILPDLVRESRENRPYFKLRRPEAY
jgi:predicted amidohydrolase